MDPFATHIPLLARGVQLFGGPIVELGAGDNSTYLLHEMAKDSMLITIETDESWLNRYNSLRSDRHDLILLKNKELIIKHLEEVELRVVFVDLANWTLRNAVLIAIADRAHCVIAHDAEAPDYQHGAKYYSHQKLYDRLRPHTAALSNRAMVVELL